MKIKPIEDRVVVQPLDASDMTSGGVILPDMAQEGTMVAKAIAVGPGKHTLSGQLVPPVTKVGDTVVLPKFGSVKIEVDGEEYMVCREAELITILEKE